MKQIFSEELCLQLDTIKREEIILALLCEALNGYLGYLSSDKVISLCRILSEIA